MSLETQFVTALGGLLCATATAAIGVITPKVKALIKAHANAKEVTTANDAVDGLAKIAQSVVSDFNQRIVNDAKSNQAFTPDLAKQIKADAVDAVEEQGASFIKLLGKSSGEVNSLISSLIEQSVAKTKNIPIAAIAAPVTTKTEPSAPAVPAQSTSVVQTNTVQ